MTALPARGEVWWCELAEIGRRPVVVLSRDAAIPRLRRTLIGPCTTTIRRIPVEVVVGPANGLDHESVINVDELQTIRVNRLIERIGELSPEQGARLDAALRFALGL